MDPLDPLDPAENSKNAIFAERVVIFGPCGVPGPPLGPHGSRGGGGVFRKNIKRMPNRKNLHKVANKGLK